MATTAPECIWHATLSAKVIDGPLRLVAQVRIFGTHADVMTLRLYLSDDELHEAINQVPAGIFDPRSWVYWKFKIGR